MKWIAELILILPVYLDNNVDVSFILKIWSIFHTSLSCLLSFVSALSLQYGVTVGGYSNETAGNASDVLSKPFGIIVGNDGSLYVGDTQNARVIHLPVGSLIGTVVAGTGTVGNGSNQLNYPSNLYVDAASNVYVSDTRNGRAMLWPNGSSTGTSVTSTTVLSTRVIGIVVDS
jgi:hypothetical protein